MPEHDDKVNPAGIKGIGEIANVGTAAALANAVYHATGILCANYRSGCKSCSPEYCLAL